MYQSLPCSWNATSRSHHYPTKTALQIPDNLLRFIHPLSGLLAFPIRRQGTFKSPPPASSSSLAA